jgi:hypothetical protein
MAIINASLETYHRPIIFSLAFVVVFLRPRELFMTSYRFVTICLDATMVCMRGVSGRIPED